VDFTVHPSGTLSKSRFQGSIDVRYLVDVTFHFSIVLAILSDVSCLEAGVFDVMRHVAWTRRGTVVTCAIING
jgi:hypothetical protein